MSKSDNLYDFFTDLANAIREKEGSTAKINPQDMAVRIAALGDKEVVKVDRGTLKELLYDIAEALREIEGSSDLINPQDMAARVLAFIKEYNIRFEKDMLVWEGDTNNEGVVLYNTLVATGEWSLEEITIEELL